MTPQDAALVRAESAARTSYGRLLALLASGTHDIAGAEDALADAFERALRTWPVDGVPARPEAWLLTVARNRQRDRWRSAEWSRTTSRDPQEDAPWHLDDVDPDAVPDRRLELMLVCAHPAIATSARTPLMLNTVLGHTAEQVARIYAVPTSTMATRLVRAKNRIRDNRIPFRVPDRGALPERMDAVLAAVYGAYVIDWSTGPGERDLPPESLHLSEVLAELAPDDPEARGLAALVGLSAARRAARIGPDGSFVPLVEQDTSKWDEVRIARAHEHLRVAHSARMLGRYQLEAAIQAVHCARAATGRTDWASLLELHHSLHAVAPSLGSRTALAAVTAQVKGSGCRAGAPRHGRGLRHGTQSHPLPAAVGDTRRTPRQAGSACGRCRRLPACDRPHPHHGRTPLSRSAPRQPPRVRRPFADSTSSGPDQA